ncbi:TRAP transporter small permease [Desulfosarcina alkanivorans]|uniref:TRAP transporter small permease n=1 Tax=Desulfosarcina alkanivorans TaxID=571177 RepID=UPI00142EEF1C|nr:TRAP transporter small permease [Desulfosarcina alkanivorans]
MEGRLKILGKLRRLGHSVNTIVGNATVVLFVVMTLIVWAQIFFRFILGDGIVWAEEIAKYMMVWMALLGASVVYAEQGHISIDFFIANSGRVRWIKMVHTLLATVLFIVLIVCGIKYAQLGQRLISPASGIRKFWPYLAIPAGGVFLLFQSGMRFIDLFTAAGDNDPEAPAGDSPSTERRGTQQ